MSTTYRICSCNRTVPLNAATGDKLGAMLGAGPLTIATQLCGKDAAQYAESVKGTDTVVVGCTQEQELFDELARESRSVAPLRFVNLRETARDAQGHAVLPKMAALLAEAALPAADPTPSVGYRSTGKTLIIGTADIALQWAEQLCAHLSVTVLITEQKGQSSLPLERRYPVLSGDKVVIQGWLGDFNVSWQQQNPIDLDLCVRCGACIEACPEQAIGLLFQVDQQKCTRHGECIEACGAAGAISFARSAPERSGNYDLIFDLSQQALISRHQPPYGYYFAAPDDQKAQFAAALLLSQMVGEFEKPKYFQYKEKLCAHGRNRKVGCTACIDICSAQAVQHEDDHIRVEPHLCAGCGACATVCPSGALGYAYPNPTHTGKRIKTLLSTYLNAKGNHPALLLHSGGKGKQLIHQLGRQSQHKQSRHGIPAHIIPLEVQHTAAVGLDLWLSAIAYGATNVAVLATQEEAPAYLTALEHQMAIAQAVLTELGYGSSHFTLIRADHSDALGERLHALMPNQVPSVAASFNVFADKRTTLDFALNHLYQHAPVKAEEIVLPAGAPYGTLQVNAAACTLCMSCTGACPSSALIATADRPQLRFIEKNCVQCGLCTVTCPENAIALLPRLNLSEKAKQAVVLNEAQPFHCIRCNKPFGTLQMIEGMFAKLANHSAFAGNLDRLKMCGDCRVVDMMEAKKAQSIAELHRVP